eukprot:TRINITY_DN10825_c0_g1_i1.p1 TRINITY_DN10825_c0_g1~~TRINITY_DN10825_c0_g1_i1.p1  ORF type:complete len:857 (+),score=171.84 TRINITY_DN10825_c0_g1_i1:1-2571(+)
MATNIPAEHRKNLALLLQARHRLLSELKHTGRVPFGIMNKIYGEIDGLRSAMPHLSEFAKWFPDDFVYRHPNLEAASSTRSLAVAASPMAPAGGHKTLDPHWIRYMQQRLQHAPGHRMLCTKLFIEFYKVFPAAREHKPKPGEFARARPHMFRFEMHASGGDLVLLSGDVVASGTTVLALPSTHPPKAAASTAIASSKHLTGEHLQWMMGRLQREASRSMPGNKLFPELYTAFPSLRALKPKCRDFVDARPDVFEYRTEDDSGTLALRDGASATMVQSRPTAAPEPRATVGQSRSIGAQEPRATAFGTVGSGKQQLTAMSVSISPAKGRNSDVKRTSQGSAIDSKEAADILEASLSQAACFAALVDESDPKLPLILFATPSASAALNINAAEHTDCLNELLDYVSGGIPICTNRPARLKQLLEAFYENSPGASGIHFSQFRRFMYDVRAMVANLDHRVFAPIGEHFYNTGFDALDETFNKQWKATYAQPRQARLEQQGELLQRVARVWKQDELAPDSLDTANMSFTHWLSAGLKEDGTGVDSTGLYLNPDFTLSTISPRPGTSTDGVDIPANIAYAIHDLDLPVLRSKVFHPQREYMVVPMDLFSRANDGTVAVTVPHEPIPVSIQVPLEELRLMFQAMTEHELMDARVPLDTEQWMVRLRYRPLVDACLLPLLKDAVTQRSNLLIIIQPQDGFYDRVSFKPTFTLLNGLKGPLGVFFSGELLAHHQLQIQPAFILTQLASSSLLESTLDDVKRHGAPIISVTYAENFEAWHKTEEAKIYSKAGVIMDSIVETTDGFVTTVTDWHERTGCSAHNEEWNATQLRLNEDGDRRVLVRYGKYSDLIAPVVEEDDPIRLD